MNEDNTIHPGDSESLDQPIESDLSEAAHEASPVSDVESTVAEGTDLPSDAVATADSSDAVKAEAVEAPDAADVAPAVVESPDNDAEEAESGNTATSEEKEDGENDADELSPNWRVESKARTLANELRRVESQVREALDGRDTRRKRKLGGSARWRELEDDILGWRYSGKIDEPTLAQLQALVARRYYLYDQLDFLSSTRPTWNS